ncbi:hypothetical protein P5G65_33475 [Paenibacillus chondroitinus]|uniref:Uncharacterized protein n=1 Tax=Paenibacillus chondroitinus TaxID=59842 RepID=A0ABU6DM14_9BACL|nr:MULTISPECIES: hypothetical protein [Paenibacillus]MCY9657025.1 hypothetical protein [Paenibacillus anseongense]MEB4798821.1 hypothetical protein [Paenibacillus chondroitinus]
MPKYANASAEATEFLRKKTGSSQLECYTYIDPDQAEDSFFIVKTSNKVTHVSFSEITYEASSYQSLLEGLYRAIYE